MLSSSFQTMVNRSPCISGVQALDALGLSIKGRQWLNFKYMLVLDTQTFQMSSTSYPGLGKTATPSLIFFKDII